MEAEISAAIITVILTSVMSTGFWFLQKYLDRKKDARDAKKVIAETDNVDSETIRKLAETVETFQGMHEDILIKYKEVRDKNIELSKEVTILQEIQETIVKENKNLSVKNERMAESIRVVQAENESLREIVSSEQLDKRRLKIGIGKLIEQMKENGITEPAFTL